MDTIQKLTELFRQFPGIGPRQAKRFVYFLLTQQNGYTGDLSKLISELKSEIACCESCFRFFPQDKSNSTECSICRDPHRDKKQLMIVSRDVDLENIEKTKSFTGLYFVLGGMVPILETHPEEKIRQRELMALVEKRSKQGLKEIIVALDYNPEGENTRDHITHLLGAFSMKLGFSISSLGRGLSTGSELEYSDPETIKNALSNRK
jgi:recombination protein RecR